MTAVAMILPALIFFFGALFIGVAKSKEKVEYELTQHHVSKMEELFRAGDIDALMEYYNKLDSRPYAYEKYRQIYAVGYFDRKWVYERYEDYVKHTETYHQTQEKEDYIRMRGDYLYWVMESGRDSLRNMYLYANDRVILGNETLLTTWREEMEEFFLTKVGLTQEELLWLRTFTAEENTEKQLKDFVQKIIERDDSAR